MIIAPDFVCIHLQKCGGSFLREYLIRNISGAKYTGEPHDKACDIPKQHRSKPILGTIRNPWDWYVSWYAGTQRSKKGHFWVLHKNGKQTTFSEFMATVMDLKKRIHNIDFGLVNRLGIGVYTYRYIQSYCHNPDQVFEQLQSQPPGEQIVCIAKFREFCYQNDNAILRLNLCRTESLRSDLLSFLTSTPTGITKSQASVLTAMAKVNTSEHGSYQDYYDQQLRQSIGEMDNYIVDRFGYTFDTRK